jgi:hypothetical protein
MISADHGEEFLERGSLDHGQTVYDESIKVPVVIYCPVLIDEPARVSQQIGLIDFGPTILSALGIEKPAVLEGTSLLPLISTRFEASREQLRPCGLPFSCLVSEGIAHRPERKAMRCPPWKLIYDPFFGAVELYNLKQDPSEVRNVIEVEPEIAANLTDILLTSLAPYYPGGWCIAWRGNGNRGTIKGTVEVGAGMIEVVGHRLHPNLDPMLDSLFTASGRRRVVFRSMVEECWEGAEIRMPSRQTARIDLDVQGSRHLAALIGQNVRQIGFPATLSPNDAEVSRDQIHTLFRQDDADLAIFWIEPGSQPTATDEKREALRRKLKAIGYID